MKLGLRKWGSAKMLAAFPQCKMYSLAPFDIRRDAPILPQLEHKRTLLRDRECAAFDPKGDMADPPKSDLKRLATSASALVARFDSFNL